MSNEDYEYQVWKEQQMLDEIDEQKKKAGSNSGLRGKDGTTHSEPTTNNKQQTRQRI